MELKKDKLLQLIEPHFGEYLTQDSYELKNIKSKKLLTNKRFDLAFKLLYLEAMGRASKFSKDIYKEHIRAFSLGKFTEPGNKEKNTIDRFIEEFQKTFEDIKVNGFDSSKTLIPLSKNSSIVNGAHRVASAIYLDKDVDCVVIDTVDHNYDYKFFYSRNVPCEMLDVIATKFVEYADHVHVAFIWPSAQGHDEKIEKLIPNIVYRKEITLTLNGAHNLLSQIYYGEEWLGSIEDDFRGTKGKLVECFKSFDPVKIIAFQASNLAEVLKIKDNVRDLFNVGKHSIHITDTKEEAIRVARVVFSDNSIHFLNYAKPNRYISTHKKIDKFKKFMIQKDIYANKLVLDGGIILSAYGLRECGDIEYFVDDKKMLMRDNGDRLDLIYNPKNYFYFNDLKFISFGRLYKMKINRNEKTDKNDCKMMEALIESNTFKTIINKHKQKYFYFKIFMREKIIYLLKLVGVFEILKKLIKG